MSVYVSATSPLLAAGARFSIVGQAGSCKTVWPAAVDGKVVDCRCTTGIKSFKEGD